MCLNILVTLFIIISSVLIVQLILLDRNITRRLEAMKASAFVSGVAGAFLAYIVSAVALAVYFKGLYSIWMLVLAILPFVFGRFVSYKTKKSFTLFQVLFIIIGIVYVLQIVNYTGA